jgi:hypothetical protein
MDTRSVSVMTVWDELRPILTRLRDDHRETLLEFPDPRLGEGQPPPYQITLAPTAVAVAEDLHRRFGDNVQLTVGRLPYLPGRQPDRPLDHLIRQSPGEGPDVAGERKVMVGARPGLGRANSACARLGLCAQRAASAQC